MSKEKHLIVIHGRATKPSKKEKNRLVKKSIIHGLGRVSESSADKVLSGEVKFKPVYYGDVSNREMMKAGKKSKADLNGRDSAYDNAPCEEDGSYDDSLKTLFERDSFTKSAYKKLLKENDDLRGLDELAGPVMRALKFFGLSDRVLRSLLPDMGAYLMQRKVGSEIRFRLHQQLEKSLKSGADVCLVSHSMGCLVSYDVLWKYSHMSEYKHLRGKKVSRWITLGNPLGDPTVRQNLYGAHERDDARYPADIIDRWVNFSAHDDIVAYNFWVGEGSNPHKLYGYLDHPNVATEIADLIQ